METCEKCKNIGWKCLLCNGMIDNDKIAMICYCCDHNVICIECYHKVDATDIDKYTHFARKFGEQHFVLDKISKIDPKWLVERGIPPPKGTQWPMCLVIEGRNIRMEKAPLNLKGMLVYISGHVNSILIHISNDIFERMLSRTAGRFQSKGYDVEIFITRRPKGLAGDNFIIYVYLKDTKTPMDDTKLMMKLLQKKIKAGMELTLSVIPSTYEIASNAIHTSENHKKLINAEHYHDVFKSS